MATNDSISPESSLEFMQTLGKHLGVLHVGFYILNKQGRRIKGPLYDTYSGFFLALGEKNAEAWFFVTAGHVFRRNDNLVGLLHEQIEVFEVSLVDYIGRDRKTEHATIIPVDHLRQTVAKYDESGFDYAFLRLHSFFVESIRLNGVVPLTDWYDTDDAEKYVVIGFPDQEKDGSDYVGLAMTGLQKCELPPDRPKPSMPYFTAKLPDEEPASAVGFSGSPIFAIKYDPATEGLLYILLGIQHSWHPKERIVVGTYMRDILLDALKATK
jgi:hypothetical protein